MNRITITAIVTIIFAVAVIAVNAYPWYLSSNKSAEWKSGIALTDDNVLLDIRYADSENSRLAVILVHDYGQDKTIWSKLDLDERLLNYDNAVVTFDLRFHGNSTPVLASGSGTYVTSSEKDYIDDIKTIVKWTEQNIGKPIVLVGYGEVSKVLLESLNKLNDPNIRGVVLIAPNYRDVADVISKANTKVMVLSDDASWSKAPVYFVSIGISGNGDIVWNNNELDMLFNWIKNRSFE